MTATKAGTHDLRVGGMTCAGCAATIESALRQVEGVSDVRIDVMGGRVRVGYTGQKNGRGDLSAAIERVGFRVEDEDAMRTSSPQGERVPAQSFWARRGRILMTVISGVALGLALLVGVLEAPSQIALALLAVSTITGGWYIVPRGLQAARNRALDMSFLMSVAAAGAWIIGEQTEAAATLFLFAIAELLEAYSMDRARNAIRSLMDLSPAEATVLRGGQEIRVPATQVEVGESVVVRPGEKIPVDGEVTNGSSSVNQASITGESMPVDKESGATVFASSLNVQGALTIRSTKPASDTTLARIIHAVEEAQASRAPSQNFVDRFARIYTPVVVGVAILVAILPPLAGYGEWETWIYRALAMLVVACPCALVISTPVSIVSGLAGAARAGILIKGGAHLENAAAITTVCFDKTGTLTAGRPALTDVIGLDGRTEVEILRLALGVERYSEHPLALAVLERGRALGISPPESSDFESLPGRGARASVEGTTIYIGNHRLGQELGVTNKDATAELERVQQAGRTAVVVATSREILAVLAIADQVRPEAWKALESLRSAGIRRTIMLTGDNEGTAQAVARQLGVDEYRAELLPDDKVRIVRELEESGERVAFVGDGVNDAPALAASTVGVAMGAAGTDVALETADIALMGDDLAKLPLAIHLSRQTLRIIRQNVWFSIGIKAIFVVLAVGGWATLWMAVAADMGASLIVVANGLRARRVRG
ncbi:MAG: heavy metal translocating P-type ATPase [Gemmatimonadaceae bacterium]